MPIVELDGFQMYYEQWGTGDPLILLHGGLGMGRDWRLIFPEDPDGYQLIVPDLRGHGRSTAPVGPFSFRACAEDVRRLLDHLRLARDTDPLYPVELAVELFRAIPNSKLWIVPSGGHRPIFGERAPSFRSAALTHLSGAYAGGIGASLIRPSPTY